MPARSPPLFAMPPTPLRRILLGLAVFLTICAVAIIAYVQMGWTLSDAIYMVVITIFGVGYSEVKPVDTPALRTLTIAIIVLGYGAAIYTVGGFIQFLVDGELQSLLRNRKMSQGIASLRGHTIVCGFGRMGVRVAEELQQLHQPFVVVDESTSRVEQAQQAGMLAMVGNATDEDTLLAAGIRHARGLATLLPDDAANAFICVTARDLADTVEIVSRAENHSAQKKLIRCGANHVVMAATIGAMRATQLLVRPTASAVLESYGLSHGISEELSAIGLSLEELELTAHSPLVGKPLGDIQVRGNRGFLIVGVKRDEAPIQMNPSGSLILKAKDIVIVVGHQNDIAELCLAHKVQRHEILYRGVKA
ncbi:Potassium channel protein [Rhodopirellula islandica]|uniref:Potassium channel protein n=1 Tax=Rhodopirellula islandica TaxID=595434 RepID=A0A0J1B4B3_RHOIS|nr:potassium channel protein [Rhodopirellula islandica]KLU01700.1 Potassium channel protein [Rhodopirellula islandica]